MHSKGDIGAQLLHSAPSVLSIPAKSRVLSAFRVEVRTLPTCFILLFEYTAYAMKRQEVKVCFARLAFAI